MDPGRWQQITDLFHRAVERPESEWRTFLVSECGSNEDLAIDVIALLEEEARAAELRLDLPDVANRLLGSLPFPANLRGLSVDQQLGPYRIGKLLGEGGMGTVYLATREDLGTCVAIKILRDAWMSPARRQRFELESRTLAQLNHPGIARLYDAETFADGTPCFVMEYVDGLPLIEYCAENRCSLRLRLQLFRSICEAVQHAHERAVIHRDLKPSNILVRRDGVVKLLDFGIAKQLDDMQKPVTQTRTELRLMTPLYAAPEQLEGRAVGVFTDVYALGAIFFELLTGRVHVDLIGCSSTEAQRILVGQEPQKPSLSVVYRADPKAQMSQVTRSEWADLDVLCLTAMHRDPERRYRSVEALVRDLDHYLADEPLEAQLDSWTYRTRKFMVRRRQPLTVAACALLLFLATVAVFTFRLARARDQALTSAVRAQRVQTLLLNLFKGGNQDAGPADDLKVVTLLDRGVQEAYALRGEPATQAELLQTLGGIYRKLGKFDRSETLMRSAIDKRRAFFGEQSAAVASTLVQTGLLRIDQAHLEDAERLIRAGVQIAERLKPRDQETVTEANLGLGKVLEARGHPEKAIIVLEKVVRDRSLNPTSAEFAESLTELANANFYAGHYDRSAELSQQALGINRQLFGEGHPFVAEDLSNLGQIQMDQGHYAEAEDPLRHAADIVQRWYGDQHPETASYLDAVGQDLSYQRRYKEAEPVSQKVLAIYLRVYGRVHPRTAIAMNSVAAVEDGLDHLGPAEVHYREAADIFRSLYGEQNSRTAIALANLATIYLEEKQYERAEQLLRKVVAIQTIALSPTHLNTGIAQVKLGRALVRQRRFRDAEEHSLAGYKIVSSQASPSVSWLGAARKDLIEIYDALGSSAMAQHYRDDLAANSLQTFAKKSH